MTFYVLMCICHLLFIKQFVFIIKAENLDICITSEKQIQDTTNCIADRQAKELKMHHIILNNYLYRQSLTLDCPVCPGEDIANFEWYHIKRSDLPIMQMKKLALTGPKVTVIPPGGKPVNKKDFQKRGPDSNVKTIDIVPCLMINSKSLFFPTFIPELYVGTYYCKNLIKSDHPSNSILYHVDVILPKEEDVISERLVGIPPELQVPQRVDNLAQVREAMSSIGKLLSQSSTFNATSGKYLKITSETDRIPTPAQSCGTFKLVRYQRCYLEIPEKLGVIDKIKMSGDELLTIAILHEAFGFLVDWKKEKDPAISKSKQDIASKKANNLGFELIIKPKVIYLPCHYTYLQHLKLTQGLPKPFQTRNLFIPLSFDFACPEIDPLEIINLALSGDLKAMKMEVLGYDQMRFMKSEKVVIENTEEYSLACSGENTEENFNCTTADHSQILWRQQNGVTFTQKGFIDERIYVTDTCLLQFENVKLQDSGFYSCYKRNSRFQHMWLKQAHVTFRLRVESARYKWPMAIDVFLGILLLSCWSGILIILWLFLTIWNYSISRTAIMQAMERKRTKENMSMNDV